MRKAYKIECEWDIGEDDLFDSREAAIAAIDRNPVLQDMVRYEGFTLDEIWSAGLINVVEVKIK